MVWPILSGNPDLVPVTASHDVTPGGLLLVAIFYLGAGLTGVGFIHFAPMGLTLACLGEMSICV